MGLPEYVWIFLAGGSLFISLVKNGEPKGNYNFFAALIALGIEFWIVWSGGFFR